MIEALQETGGPGLRDILEGKRNADLYRASVRDISRTQRFHRPAPPHEEFEPDPGMLLRTDLGSDLPEQTPEEHRDPRPAW
ncbi:hypothetical protein [Embleya sp. NBC_00896]|uniref:hypothetical protein n=1 Tax=Embleya sp. NBC_00896 TaxID=2975961 RepID=UPI003867EDCE|nr:hypothetical protein OG928_00350 [Embleya sp. NBC_00896]